MVKLNPRELKCWGDVAHIFVSDRAAVSHLRVDRGFRCSRHYHRERANQFAVISGRIIVEEWEDNAIVETSLCAGQSYTVPSGRIHRFRVCESGELIEVYWPDDGGTVRLDDIVRLDEGGRDDDRE
jgi:mannose-6-phosphate isomerase-like protein (cupin superfamily)